MRLQGPLQYRDVAVNRVSALSTGEEGWCRINCSSLAAICSQPSLSLEEDNEKLLNITNSTSGSITQAEGMCYMFSLCHKALLTIHHLL